MPVYDTAPGRLAPSTWAQIHYRDPVGAEHVYQITAVDVIYCAAIAAAEDSDHPMIIWTYFQNFCGKSYIRNGGWRGWAGGGRLARQMEMHSTTANPTFAHGRPRPTDPCPGADPSGIPGACSPSIWRAIATDRTITNTGWIGALVPAAVERRASKYARMRRAIQDDSAWRSFEGAARRAAFNCCTARWGNPVPGMDDFASRPASNMGARFIHLYDMSGAERNTAVQRVTSQTGGEAEGRMLLATFSTWLGRDEDLRRRTFYCYRNLAGMRDPALVWLECEGRDTRRTNIPVVSVYPGLVSGTLVSRISDDGTITAQQAVASGGPVETTQEGLAPTPEVPAGSSAISGTSTTAQSDGTSDPLAIPPPRADIMNGLREWADGAEVELGQQYGGRRS